MRRIMTSAQMRHLMQQGLAWVETKDGVASEVWCAPIWTKDGGWMWDEKLQAYQLVA